MEESILGNVKIVCRAAAAHDRSCHAGPVNSVIDQSVVNMNADGLTQNKPLLERFVGFALELDD